MIDCLNKSTLISVWDKNEVAQLQLRNFFENPVRVNQVLVKRVDSVKEQYK